MIHSIIQYLQGYLILCVEGDSAERFLNLCSYHKIYIWNVTIHDNVYELQIRIKDFRKIRPIARKTHTHVKIKNRFGFPFFIYSHKVRVFLSCWNYFLHLFVKRMLRQNMGCTF